MAYLGRAVDSGAISNIQNLDNITFDGSSSYTLQKGGSNFVPSSANAILISIDGVVNAGNFTVSSSTIDFGVAVSSSSVCNFIIHLGVGIVTAPSDGSVNNTSIASNAGIATTKLGTGAVLQVVQGTHATEVINSTTTYTDTGLTASITPSSTSNKILVLVNQSYLIQDPSGDSAGGAIRLIRGTTRISGGIERFELWIRALGNNNRSVYGRQTINFLDTPSSTSSVTYKTQSARYTGTDIITTCPSSMEASITLMEIAG